MFLIAFLDDERLDPGKEVIVTLQAIHRGAPAGIDMGLFAGIVREIDPDDPESAGVAGKRIADRLLEMEAFRFLAKNVRGDVDDHDVKPLLPLLVADQVAFVMDPDESAVFFLNSVFALVEGGDGDLIEDGLQSLRPVFPINHRGKTILELRPELGKAIAQKGKHVVADEREIVFVLVRGIKKIPPGALCKSTSIALTYSGEYCFWDSIERGAKTPIFLRLTLIIPSTGLK